VQLQHVSLKQLAGLWVRAKLVHLDIDWQLLHGYQNLKLLWHVFMYVVRQTL